VWGWYANFPQSSIRAVFNARAGVLRAVGRVQAARGGRHHVQRGAEPAHRPRSCRGRQRGGGAAGLRPLLPQARGQLVLLRLRGSRHGVVVRHVLRRPRRRRRGLRARSARGRARRRRASRPVDAPRRHILARRRGGVRADGGRGGRCRGGGPGRAALLPRPGAVCTAGDAGGAAGGGDLAGLADGLRHRQAHHGGPRQLRRAGVPSTQLCGVGSPETQPERPTKGRLRD
jgi:hypothetical protein